MLGQKPQRVYPPAIAVPGERRALEVVGFSVGDAVRGVDLSVRDGEIVGIGGLEGHGQSQLLLGLFGVLSSRGDVAVNGRPMRIRSPRDALSAGLGIALVPEDRKRQGLLLQKSIADNVGLAVLSRLSRLGLVDSRAQRALAARAVDDLSIHCRSTDQTVSSLSGGNQQKVVIAKLLAVDARILLFHDLTRGVDVGTKAEIFALARRLTAEGYSIVLYSSDNEELIHMCDRVLVFKEGRIAAELTAQSLSEEAIMRAALGIAAS
jgi:ribose transport system ATP-binding protein